MDCPILDTSYQWNHTLCGLLCLASFAQHDVFKVHLHWSCFSVLLLFLAKSYSMIMDGPNFAYPSIHWETLGVGGRVFSFCRCFMRASWLWVTSWHPARWLFTKTLFRICRPPRPSSITSLTFEISHGFITVLSSLTRNGEFRLILLKDASLVW